MRPGRPEIAAKRGDCVDSDASGRARVCQPDDMNGTDPLDDAFGLLFGRGTSTQKRSAEDAALGRPMSVTILELTDNMCRWPIKDAEADEFRYCGAPTRGGPSSYCAGHSRRAYQAASQLRRAPDRGAAFPGLGAERRKG